MHGTQHTIRRLIAISLSDRVTGTHSSFVANLLYKFEPIINSNLYFPQCILLENTFWS